MLKFSCILLGENYQYVKNFQYSSKRKINLLATSMILPVILWLINGYLLSKVVLSGSFGISIITALITALIIFLIERTIIMSNGSKFLYLFRVFIGVIVALLGSVSMDEVVFKHDIDNQMTTFKQNFIESSIQKVKNEKKLQLDNQQAIVEKKYNDWQKRLDDVNSEMKGLSGSSGFRGKGKIATENIRMASLLESDYKIENVKLEKLKAEINNIINDAKAKAESDFRENALLARIKAMFELISTDIYMRGFYILVSLLLFSIEFLVVIMKICNKSSIDEDMEIAREKLMRAKTQQTLDRLSIFYEPEQYLPSVKKANEMVKHNYSSNFN